MKRTLLVLVLVLRPLPRVLLMTLRTLRCYSCYSYPNRYYYYELTLPLRYHSDPDQGTVFARDTAVVSFGAPRDFVLRPAASEAGLSPREVEARHCRYHVCDGDVVHMFRDCQDTYQHAIRRETAKEAGPRISLVFKRAIEQPR